MAGLDPAIHVFGSQQRNVETGILREEALRAFWPGMLSAVEWFSWLTI
jgi:hypothetical protein